MAVEPLLIAKSDKEIYLYPGMANRHGLIAGATGTGKSISLKVLAENFSRCGVPVFLTDVKGDMSGICNEGKTHPKIFERVDMLGLDDFAFEKFPVAFWDIFREKGHPVRTTISEMGPLLISRLLNLNDTQTGTLSMIFRVADDNGLLLLDLKDLRAMLTFAKENADKIESDYGHISAASVGAIQRALLSLEEGGGEKLFGEPGLKLDDLMQTDADGKGVINVFMADQLIMSPRSYSTFLLWLLSELFEELPEVGDAEKPRLVFFFDEAHLLFKDAPKVLVEKIEQVVRLIRSKGVGIYFVSQSPMDVPEEILGQLGNRIQHALRSYTPKDQKAVKAAAETFRVNPDLDAKAAIGELIVGEALVSFLDEEGTPGMVERAYILPPRSQIGPITPEERKTVIEQSAVYGYYEKEIDRESAYEILKANSEKKVVKEEEVQKRKPSSLLDGIFPSTTTTNKRGRKKDSLAETLLKSAVRSSGNALGRQIVRGILGSFLK